VRKFAVKEPDYINTSRERIHTVEKIPVIGHAVDADLMPVRLKRFIAQRIA
jgi:hypothetical protein